MATIYWRFYVN